MPKDTSIRKVLVIGSGPIVIGQAAEFDYAGAQACRVLKEEGVNVVLVNSNPATIMTDRHLADEIYLEPLNPETLRRIIEAERPDGLLAGLGGQTALTLAMQLDKDGTLREFNVRLLGSPIEAIQRAEDREQFRDTMRRIGQPCVPSEIAETVPDALSAAGHIGYPVIVRPAYTLGGSGGGIAADAGELRQIARSGLDASPIHQKDFSDLPPAYTFVGNGEPFYAETLEYVRKLKEANIEAEVDVYPSDMHAFDMLDPESEVSQQAIRTFEEKFEKALMRIQNEDQKQ